MEKINKEISTVLDGLRYEVEILPMVAIGFGQELCCQIQDLKAQECTPYRIGQAMAYERAMEIICKDKSLRRSIEAMHSLLITSMASPANEGVEGFKCGLKKAITLLVRGTIMWTS